MTTPTQPPADWPPQSDRVLTLADSLADLAGEARPGDASKLPAWTVKDLGAETYLDGIEAQFYIEDEQGHVVAYVFSKEDAHRIAAAPAPVAQEPVAWMDDGSTGGRGQPAYRVITASTKDGMSPGVAAAYATPLYAHPAPAPVAQPANPTMTRDELVAAAESIGMRFPAPVAQCRDDGRCQYAIDHGAEGLAACPKGKCAMLPAPVAQPVAWRYKYRFRDVGETGAYEYHSHEFACVACLPKGEPLYTHPAPAPVLTPAQKHADELLEALRAADRTFAENGLLACHAARQEIRAAINKIEATGQEGGK